MVRKYMSVNIYNSQTGNLETLASSSRVWIGTKEAYKSAKQSGQLPSSCIIYITDDEQDHNHYSTDEVETGMYWIDGKPIYRKVINFGSLPNISQKGVAHGITNLGTIINIFGYAKSGSTFLTIPYDYRTTGIDQNVNIYVNTSNVFARSNWNCSEYSAVIILEYTKTTD